jgi:hypothetical protein
VRVAELELRVAVLVDADDEVAAALVGGAVEIPVGLEHDGPAPGGDVVAADGKGVAAGVRRGEERGAVGHPHGTAVLRVALVRRRVRDLAACDVQQEEIGVAGPLAEALGCDQGPSGEIEATSQ